MAAQQQQEGSLIFHICWSSSHSELHIVIDAKNGAARVQHGPDKYLVWKTEFLLEKERKTRTRRARHKLHKNHKKHALRFLVSLC